MSQKNAQKGTTKKSQSGYLGKVLGISVFVLIIVGFIYWGSDEANKTSENPVAKGVAKFYAEVRQALKPGAERLNDYTIKLPEPEVSMGDQLESRDGAVRPAPENWNGANIKRSFKQNDTLKTALSQYANDEGIELIWDLQYDYIVKHHFAETSDMKTLIRKISTTVTGDYSGNVKTYFCKDARALVITDKSDPYLTEYCEENVANF